MDTLTYTPQITGISSLFRSSTGCLESGCEICLNKGVPETYSMWSTTW